MSDLLVVRDLYKNFVLGHENLEVLKGLNFKACKAAFTAIVGASGTGKSTFLHLLGSLDRPTSGEIALNGTDYSEMDAFQLAELRNTKIGFVFQFHHLLPEFSALENVMMPALISGRRKATVIKQASAILGELGLGDRQRHKPSELSGGEQQRVAVARALINQPVLLLLDEPTGNLDRVNGENLFSMIKDLQNSIQITTVMVTHNLSLAKQVDRVLHLRDGRLHAFERDDEDPSVA